MSKPRAYVSSFTIHCGPITTRGRLLPIRLPDAAPKLHLCTPDGHPVKQAYIDAEGNVYEREALGRGTLDDDGNIIPVDTEAVEDAKTSRLPLNSITLTVHDESDISEQLFPSNHNAYIFEPVIKQNNKVIEDPVNVKWHDILNAMVRDSGVVFLGKCNLRNNEGLYRLGMYQGYMVMQRMLYPESLNSYDHLDIDVPKERRANANRVIRSLIAPFDPAEYEDEIAHRITEVASEDFDPSTIKRDQPKAEDFDIDAALEAFI